jgi:hypothetical protein
MRLDLRLPLDVESAFNRVAEPRSIPFARHKEPSKWPAA